VNEAEHDEIGDTLTRRKRWTSVEKAW